MSSSPHRDLPEQPLAAEVVPTAAHSASLRTQLSRFVAVGVLSAVVDLGLTLLLTSLGWHRSAAKAVGWVFGTITAYIMNSKWTFNSTVSRGTAAAVIVLYAATFGVQNLLYWLTEPPLLALGFSGVTKDVVAFVIAQAVATVTNFIIQRVFIFKSR